MGIFDFLFGPRRRVPSWASGFTASEDFEAFVDAVGAHLAARGYTVEREEIATGSVLLPPELVLHDLAHGCANAARAAWPALLAELPVPRPAAEAKDAKKRDAPKPKRNQQPKNGDVRLEFHADGTLRIQSGGQELNINEPSADPDNDALAPSDAVSAAQHIVRELSSVPPPPYHEAPFTDAIRLLQQRGIALPPIADEVRRALVEVLVQASDAAPTHVDDAATGPRLAIVPSLDDLRPDKKIGYDALPELYAIAKQGVRFNDILDANIEALTANAYRPAEHFYWLVRVCILFDDAKRLDATLERGGPKGWQTTWAAYDEIRAAAGTRSVDELVAVCRKARTPSFVAGRDATNGMVVGTGVIRPDWLAFSHPKCALLVAAATA